MFLIAAVERRWFGDIGADLVLSILGDDTALGTWCGEVGVLREGWRDDSRRDSASG